MGRKRFVYGSRDESGRRENPFPRTRCALPTHGEGMLRVSWTSSDARFRDDATRPAGMMSSDDVSHQDAWPRSAASVSPHRHAHLRPRDEIGLDLALLLGLDDMRPIEPEAVVELLRGHGGNEH